MNLVEVGFSPLSHCLLLCLPVSLLLGWPTLTVTNPYTALLSHLAHILVAAASDGGREAAEVPFILTYLLPALPLQLYI